MEAQRLDLERAILTQAKLSALKRLPQHLRRVSVTPDMIRRLLRFQEGFCAVTSVRLCLPYDEACDGPANQTLDTLAKKLRLPREARMRLPVLERLAGNRSTELGNLVIVSAAAAVLYREVGGIGGG